jgi:hypothetical protein
MVQVHQSFQFLDGIQEAFSECIDVNNDKKKLNTLDLQES